MTRHGRNDQLLASLLAALAGFVDATGFVMTGGFFVSFMSGNSTRLGIGFSQDASAAVTAVSLIGAFVLGVVVGAVLSHVAGAWRRSLILALVAVLLAVSAGLSTLGMQRAAVACMAVGMGVMNNVFAREGEVSIGVTYMTGSLVKLGQRLAWALLGKGRWDWVPYFLLWVGFIGGALLGARVYARFGSGALLLAASVAAVLALVPPSGGAD